MEDEDWVESLREEHSLGRDTNGRRIHMRTVSLEGRGLSRPAALYAEASGSPWIDERENAQRFEKTTDCEHSSATASSP